ncbi:hypothetical protein R1flu_018395 [Riccia fluitans]|uniref:Uncharacterized protein n=1 Tax=Riccia fluitans TaxID=41844 RepID=A0ABD1ZFQ0_9MARC
MQIPQLLTVRELRVAPAVRVYQTAVVDLVNFITDTNRYRQGTNTRAYSSTRLNQYSTIVLRVLPSTGTGVSVGSV